MLTNILVKKTVFFVCFLLMVRTLFPSIPYANLCMSPIAINPEKEQKKLIVVIPATSHSTSEWKSFYKKYIENPNSQGHAWLFIDHQIGFTSFGKVRTIAQSISACVNQVVSNGEYESITLIGHSIGGMLARRAYLEAAGQFADYEKASTQWADKIDKILLFASVNRGIPNDVHWWAPFANWLLRSLPHPRLVLEDMAYGSDFIIDTRIAWVRYFATLGHKGSLVPRVVQFWGDQDSVVNEDDNADLEAFSGKVIERVADAKHGDLIRLEKEYTNSPEIRWGLFEKELFSSSTKKDIIVSSVNSKKQKILIILHGIRDSSNSEWANDLKRRATKYYGEEAIEAPDYGFFTAAHFAFSPLREKNIPKFRDLYGQLVAENPLAEFDFIGHSNGTYILAKSLLTTPSMVFRNVSLIAPVVSDEFDWGLIFSKGQIKSIRYDVATEDWPVGILCAALDALGSSEVGPSGVTLFKGNSDAMARSRLKKVGWYDGGHSIALHPTNRDHLLKFVETGSYFDAGLKLKNDVGWMRTVSNATPYIIWTFVLGLLWWIVKAGRVKAIKRTSITILALFIAYIILDII